MPALAFGLKAVKPAQGSTKLAQKRKAIFDEPAEDEDNDDSAFSALQISKPTKSKSDSIVDNDSEPPRKFPKLTGAPSQSTNRTAKYSNLSALRSAKLQDEEASKADASVYDYDAVYETFHAPKDKKKADEPSGPKYMGSLLQSAEVRKRDQLRAKEKLLQKEREAEGDEFAGTEKFVTGAYKQQLEDNRKLEEEERRRAEEEEEKRRKGGGMTEFNKNLLQKEEERQREIQKATEEAQKRKAVGVDMIDAEDDMDVDENELAADLIRKGGKIVINDEGEVVDKRQLLSAGLNVAPKKPTSASQDKKSTQMTRPQDWRRSEKAQDARMSQRERQTRMIERQIEEINEQQRQAQEAEKKELEEKNKSKLTEDAKMSAKERYLRRKKEREEQAKKEKSVG